jgi:uncharacterized membrane protein
MKKTIIVFYLLALGFNACVNKNEEDLLADCDTSNAQYATVVQPILQQRCYACHAQGIGLGGVVLEGYSQAAFYANNGLLVGTISHSPGFNPMPQGQAKIPQCDIDKIKKWVDDGALDN